MNATAGAMHLTRRSATEIAGAIAAGEVTAREVTDEHLARIDAVDGSIHAFLHVDHEGARAQADAVDAKRAAGAQLGPLAGVPVALKDVFTQKGWIAHSRRVASSLRLDGGVPPARRGLCDSGQDKHGRIRNGLVDGTLRIRADS